MRTTEQYNLSLSLLLLLLMLLNLLIGVGFYLGEELGDRYVTILMGGNWIRTARCRAKDVRIECMIGDENSRKDYKSYNRQEAYSESVGMVVMLLSW